MLKWYDLKSPCGTMCVKAETETGAKREAAERWGCTESDIICTGHSPYSGALRLF